MSLRTEFVRRSKYAGSLWESSSCPGPRTDQDLWRVHERDHHRVSGLPRGKYPQGECLLIVEGASEQEPDLEEVDLIQEIDLLVQSGMKRTKRLNRLPNNSGYKRVNFMPVTTKRKKKGESDGN